MVGQTKRKVQPISEAMRRAGDGHGWTAAPPHAVTMHDWIVWMNRLKDARFTYTMADRTGGDRVPQGARVTLDMPKQMLGFADAGDKQHIPTEGQPYLFFVAGESEPLLRTAVKIRRDTITLRPLGAGKLDVADVEVGLFAVHYFAAVTIPRRAAKPKATSHQLAIRKCPKEWAALSRFYDAMMRWDYEPLAEDFAAVWPLIYKLEAAGAKFDPQFIRTLQAIEAWMRDGDEDGDAFTLERSEDDFALPRERYKQVAAA